MKHWNWLGHIDVVDGVLSDTLHTGCGLAHINAIRKGLSNASWCLVLEDDARLNCSNTDFLNSVNEAVTRYTEWDAVMLGPNSHRLFHAPTEIYQVSTNFIKVSSTKSIRNCTGMLWSKNAIPLIQEYSRLLNEGYVFPIDRMITSFKYPWICTRDTGDEAPNAVPIYPLPNLWISSRVFVFQESGIFSDNAYAISDDLLSDSVEYMKELVSKADLQAQSSRL
jgi:GR25 family glycosyltransferase involved in LPS biosynthesis